jgi:hypothetical protein
MYNICIGENEMTTIYQYNGKAYETLEDAEEAVMESNPQILDDDFSDFCDSNIEEFDSADFAE